MRILLNGNFGGFCIPEEIEELAKKKFGEKSCSSYDASIEVREDEEVIAAVLEYYKNKKTNLYIIEFPECIPIRINEYDGSESISIDWRELFRLSICGLLTDEQKELTKKVLNNEKIFNEKDVGV